MQLERQEPALISAALLPSLQRKVAAEEGAHRLPWGGPPGEMT